MDIVKPTLSPNVERDLDEIYHSNLERTRFSIQFYEELDDLEAFGQTDEVSPELFAYCKTRNFFVNILAYRKDRIFLRRNIGLPGGMPLTVVSARESSIHSRWWETPQHAKQLKHLERSMFTESECSAQERIARS